MENTLATNDFEVMPDGSIKLYAYLEDVVTVSRALTNNGLVIQHLSQNGGTVWKAIFPCL
ncbi:hypothetical protein [Gracilibacillus sp. JCM 18860]|uniref:hypothetical protein n=1 Tax=Gracilibacillus sp. JCM 18860 TaxID=1306159 RepID=UPI0032601C4A